MEKFPELVVIKGKEYYNVEDVVAYDLNFFPGLNKKMRKVIENHNLQETDYIYGKLLKDGWFSSEKINNKAKVLLTKEWTETHVPKIMKTINERNINQEDEKKNCWRK